MAAAQEGQTAAQVQLANWYLSRNRYGSSGFEQGFEWLQRAADSGDEVAQWHMGCLYLQIIRLPDSRRNAAHWLQQAAAHDFAPALESLADLYLRNETAADNDHAAFALYARAAEQAYPSVLCHLAYLHNQGIGTSHDPGAAAACYLQALALSHPPAYVALGLRFAVGAGIPQDRAFGHALLRRAADAGHPAATGLAADLALNPAEYSTSNRWHTTLKENLATARPLLDAIAQVDARKEPDVLQTRLTDLSRHVQTLRHPAIQLDKQNRLMIETAPGTDTFAAPEFRTWEATPQPRVIAYSNFATSEECAYFMGMVDEQLVSPRRYSHGHAYADLTLFDGEGVPLGPLVADPVIRNLERRISKICGLPRDHFEPFSVIRYLPSQQYKPHVDYFTEAQLEINRTQYADDAGQRIATFLLYLRTPEAGGETRFEKADLNLRGETGMGILHYNCLPDGSPDRDSVHAGLPITRGEKWLARLAIRARPFIQQ